MVGCQRDRDCQGVTAVLRAGDLLGEEPVAMRDMLTQLRDGGLHMSAACGEAPTGFWVPL